MTRKFGLAGVSSLLVVAVLAACGGSGGGTIETPPPNNVPNVPRFAYVANLNDNTVSMYTVNATTGQLRHNGYVATGTAPRSVTVAPSGKFAYVANDVSGTGTVSGYTINTGTGMLTAIDADGAVAGIQNFAAGSNPYSVTVDPTGKFAYVANALSDSISAYSIDATTGVLTQIICATACQGNNFLAGTLPVSVTIDSTGKYAYVVNSGSKDVSAYTIEATGALTSLGTAVATGGTNPRAITIAPSAKFAYVANDGANDGSDSVAAYTINSSGVLTRIDAIPGVGGTDNFPAETHPTSVSIDPSGKYAYVANFGSASISAYAIDAATGVLTVVDQNGAVAGTAVAAGTNPTSVTVDPSGLFAYVTNFGSNNVSTYSINSATGALTNLQTVAGRSGNLSMAMTHGTAAVTYTPKFAYVANFSHANISAFTINASSGALTEIDQNGAAVGTAVAAGTDPASVTVTPSGTFAYVANSTSGDISAYTIDATTGALTQVACTVGACNGSNFLAGSSPRSVTVDPSGKFAYVANYISDTVSAYSIDASTGALTEIDQNGVAAGTTVTAGNGPNSVTIDPSGKFAYVASYFSSVVSAFSINTVTGALTALNFVDPAVTAIGGTNPFSVTVDASGKFAYVANFSTDDISAYSIDSSTGVLTAIDQNGAVAGTTVAAGTNPRSVTLDPSGKFAYVANWFSNDVSAYTIASTGVLTQIACTDGATVCNGSKFKAKSAPRSVTVDPSGKFAYVANSSSDNVSIYTINATTGALSSVGTAVVELTGGGPHFITTTGTIQ